MSDQWISLSAPLSGVLVPLADVPDPVFAARMVGDGVSIDPTSQQLLAPCVGTVTMIHAAGHALTLSHASGLELMMHIGLDTVALKGQGFHPLVKVGQVVQAGDVLIEFEADTVALAARSLLTQVLVTHSDRVAEVEPRQGTVTASEQVCMRVRVKGSAAAEAAVTGDAVLSDELLISNPNGLHARPAAVLSGLARRYRADVELTRGTDRGNAKSVVGLMTLQIQHGDKVRFQARGTDAAEAVKALAAAVLEGLGEDHAAPAAVVPQAVAAPVESEPGVWHGMGASPGMAVGRIFQLRRQERVVVEAGRDPATERRQLQAAVDQAGLELTALETRLAAETGAEKAAIFAAHRELLEDPDLTEPVWAAIGAGKSAAYAWQKACMAQADRLAALKEPLLAARANDMRDVSERVLRLMLGDVAAPVEIPADSLLVAEDLTPSETAAIDRTLVLGLVTMHGGTTSHVAILARSLDLPAIVGIDPGAARIENGVMAILDGSKGTLRIDPSPAQIEAVRVRQKEQGERRQKLMSHATEAAVTRDGVAVEVVANLGQTSEAEQAVHMGAEGCGLLRSEFLFMGRTTAPTEDEQAEAYVTIAKALGPERRLIIRTLDVGGDKPLTYLPIPAEENPFLGERGVRVSLAHPDMFRQQLRAILKAAGLAKLGIMLPMIATMAELKEARQIFEEEREKLKAPKVPLGVMIEVPAAAMLADCLAREAEFFSIGTNDLTQYTLAVDRGHPRLAAMADAMHPAVLRLIHMTVEAAHKHGRWVGICGGLASDPQAVPILVGLKVDELSVVVPSVPATKAAIRDLDSAHCQALAEKALSLDSAAAVRALTEVGP